MTSFRAGRNYLGNFLATFNAMSNMQLATSSEKGVISIDNELDARCCKNARIMIALSCKNLTAFNFVTTSFIPYCIVFHIIHNSKFCTRKAAARPDITVIYCNTDSLSGRAQTTNLPSLL